MFAIVARRRAARIALFAVATATCLAVRPAAAPAAPGDGASPIPMFPNGWRLAPRTRWAGNVPGKLRFQRYEGMPLGTMTVDDGIAVSDDAAFSNGTIDFDVKPLAFSDTGIVFRRRGERTGEIVYLRADPDCPAADDCIQYAPITHGLMQWDIYANFQGPAPLATTGWNHVRIVVAGEKMAVYVNRQAEPSLVVPRLESGATSGGIAFKGPAIYANLVLRPGLATALDGMPPEVTPPGTVLAWSVAPPRPAPLGRVPAGTSLPPAGAWRPIAAEPDGLVNLSRAIGTCAAPRPCVAWLKTTVSADRPMRRTIALGWTREIAVFLNGKRIYAADNTYYPADRRLTVEGRLEPDDARVPLDLRRGENDVVLAVGNAWHPYAGPVHASYYGWAAEARFPDASGLNFR